MTPSVFLQYIPATCMISTFISFRFHSLLRMDIGAELVINDIFQRNVAVQTITEILELALDFGNIKTARQGRRRGSNSLHLEQHGVTVGRKLLVRFHLVDR
jgi:hypothetical protein